MPSVGRLRIEGSINTRFARVKSILLPEDLAQNDRAQWVMEYDSLLREHPERDLTDREFFDDEGSLSRRDSVKWSRLTAGFFAASLLQSRIPFYFASLFHIGRQIKVTEAALQDCRTLQNQNNLTASAQNLVSEVRSGNGRLNSRRLDIREATQTIMGLCETAIVQHEANLTTARNWWRVWQTEVDEIRRLVSQIEEYASSENRRGHMDWLRPAMRLMLLSSSLSALQSAMIQDGVRFKAEATNANMLSPQTIPPAMQLFSIFSLALLASDAYDEPMHWHHLDHILHDYIQELREARFAPAVEEATHALLEKYGPENPFLKYAVGVQAPDEALLSLIRENQLPNNKVFAWLQEWDSSFYHNMAYERFLSLSRSNTPLHDLSIAAAWHADNQIKRYLSRNSWPDLPWNARLQQIFEKEWVRDYARLVIKSSQESGDNAPLMYFETFVQFQSQVVEHLNGIGYSLHVPNQNLLKHIYDKVTSE